MYNNFLLKTYEKDRKIAGYKWSVENPRMVVCLIHGLAEYAGRYERVAAAFAEKGIAMVSMDLRGHGISSGKRDHAAPRKEVLKDIDALVDYAKENWPGIPMAMYGHSLGGNLTLDYRARGTYNDYMACYIVSAPWLLLYKDMPAPAVQLVKLLSKIKPDLHLASGIDEKQLGHPERVGGYGKDPLVGDGISAQTAIEAYEIGKKLARGIYDAETNRAKDIPMLLMHGTADTICSIEGSRQYAAQEDQSCRFVEWEEYCHEIHNGGPEANGDEVLKTMAEYLEKQLTMK